MSQTECSRFAPRVSRLYPPAWLLSGYGAMVGRRAFPMASLVFAVISQRHCTFGRVVLSAPFGPTTLLATSSSWGDEQISTSSMPLL